MQQKIASKLFPTSISAHEQNTDDNNSNTLSSASLNKDEVSNDGALSAGSSDHSTKSTNGITSQSGADQVEVNSSESVAPSTHDDHEKRPPVITSSMLLLLGASLSVLAFSIIIAYVYS